MAMMDGRTEAMEKVMNKTCGDCKHEKEEYCTRYPPVMNLYFVDGYKTESPLVGKGGTACGEFDAKVDGPEFKADLCYHCEHPVSHHGAKNNIPGCSKLIDSGEWPLYCDCPLTYAELVNE